MQSDNSTLTIGNKTYKPLTRAIYRLSIETTYPGAGTFANPIERFPDIRVHNAIYLSTESDEDSGMDGGIEPSLELFEPLIPSTDNYYLPWNITEGLILTDEGKWEGWSAWMGNDNDQIYESKLQFLGADDSHVFVKWTGSDSDDHPFVFEGALQIAPIIMYGLASLDVPHILSRLFGEDQAASLIVNAEAVKGRQHPEWVKYEIRKK
ncbi:MAG: hypothetical protein WCG35_08560 [Betaproteobacteria bacterium]